MLAVLLLDLAPQGPMSLAIDGVFVERGTRRSRLPPRTRSSRLRVASLAFVAALAACNVGFDPHHLERLEYGVDRARIEAALEIQGVTRGRFFLPAAGGGFVDCALVSFQAFHPHPDYLALLCDGRLEHIRPVQQRRWYDFDRDVPLWSAADWRAESQELIASRPALRWEELEPEDSAMLKEGPHPTVSAIPTIVLGLPYLLLLPVVLPLNQLMMGDSVERREHAVAELTAIAAGASYDDVIARIGEPTKAFTGPAGSDLLVCAWEIRHGNWFQHGVMLGFEARRLVWIDLFLNGRVEDLKPKPPEK